jgi:hypothetical protein
MSISSVSAMYQSIQAQNTPQPRNAPAPPASQPQDSVRLSAAALAASGDADHDGDSK